MKIGLVSPYDYSFPGGVVNHIFHLADYLCQRGHQVKIIAPGVNDTKRYHNQNIKVMGRPFPIPYDGSTARIPLSPWLPAQVRRILREEHFDILHLHEPFAPLLCVSALAYSTGTTVGTFHACHARSRTYSVSQPLLKRWFPKLNGKITVSQAALNYVTRYFPGEYHIIPNGIDIKCFSPIGPHRTEFDDGKLNVLFVGRLEKRKGLEHLINACAIVKKELSNFRLIVVGPVTRMRTGYQEQARKLNLDDIVFTGFVSNEELPHYYRTADIFCAPATGGESFGIVLLEAMACGKPVVASNIEGYASVLTHGEEGLLVPPADEEALAQALLSLLHDRSRREQMGTRGEIKSAMYSWENVAGQVMKYYQSVLH